MTAGTRNALVMPCSGISSRMAAGSTSRMTMLVQPLYRPTIAQPAPAMWNIGITARFTRSGVNRHCSRDAGDAAEEVVVGEHHALGQAGGARRVELQGDVVGPDSYARVVGRVRRRASRRRPASGRGRRSPRSCAPSVSVGLDLLDVRARTPARRRSPSAWASLMICAISGGGQPPVDATRDGAELGRPERHLEVLGAVLVDERDAVVGAHAVGASASATWLERRSSSPKLIDRSPISTPLCPDVPRRGADDVSDGVIVMDGSSRVRSVPAGPTAGLRGPEHRVAAVVERRPGREPAHPHVVIELLTGADDVRDAASTST